MNPRTSLLPLLLVFLPPFAAAKDDAQKIGFREISRIVVDKFNIDELINSKQKAPILASTAQSSWQNPTFSYGAGSLVYNGGQGRSGYDELSVSQTITINGERGRQAQQGQILGKIGHFQGHQTKLNLMRSAFVAVLQFDVERQRRQHVEERRKYLRLVSHFLKSRAFSSPQKKLELRLIKNKLQEVEMEASKILLDLRASQRNLIHYIGDFLEEEIQIQLVSDSKIQQMAEQLIQSDTIEKRIFGEKEKYFHLAEKTEKLKWVPDLQLYYSRSNERYAGGNRNQVLGVGIEVPIFNLGRAKTKSVEADRMIAQIEYEIANNQIDSRKSRFYNSIQSALSFRQIYNDQSIHESEKLLKLFQDDFRKGLIGAASFLDFEDQVHRIHNESLQTNIELYDSLLGLMELAGDESYLEELM